MKNSTIIAMFVISTALTVVLFAINQKQKTQRPQPAPRNQQMTGTSIIEKIIGLFGNGDENESSGDNSNGNNSNLINDPSY